MKTCLLVCAVWMLGMAEARADVTVVQKMEGKGENVEITSRFKDGKTRVDSSPGTSLIIDLKTGETISLMHTSKTYLKISRNMVPTTTDGTKPVQENLRQEKPVYAATGRKDSISGFAVEEYNYTVNGAKMTLWLTKALPDYEKVIGEMCGTLGQEPWGPLVASDRIGATCLPGIPIRMVYESAPGQTVTQTVVSVSTQPVASSEFEIPADYREMGAPVLTPPAAVDPSPLPSPSPR